RTGEAVRRLASPRSEAPSARAGGGDPGRNRPACARTRRYARRVSDEALLQISVRPAQERARLERKARVLAWSGNAWHVVELAVALAAGFAAGSVALIGFGFDSLIELAAGSVIVWLFSGGRGNSVDAERRAQRLIAASYLLLVAYIVVE